MRWVIGTIGAVLVCGYTSAQVPFTARQGMDTARQHVRANNLPSVVGVIRGLDEQGKGEAWGYGFRVNDTLVGVIVQQPTVGQFIVTTIPSIDTSDLPVYVNADPLPTDFIDSDSVMAIFSQNSIYQHWNEQYVKDPTTVQLIAGYRRQQYPMPPFFPVWIYSVTATDRVNRLMCWCTADGTSYGCEAGMEGGYRFSVQEGLEFSQQTARTTEQPCLTMALGTDTMGRSPAWHYVFPVADSLVAVVTQGIAEGIYHAMTVPIEDTTGDNIPVYVRATPFALGWINSTTALERMRGTHGFRQWVGSHRYDSTNTFLIAGRLRGNEPVAQGTGVWLFGTQAIDQPDQRLYCWCNLELVGQPFAECVAELVSVQQVLGSSAVVVTPNPASDAAVIRLSDERTIEQVTVFDLHGKAQVVPLLLGGSIAWLDLSRLSTGSYCVVVQASGTFSRQLLQVIR